MDRKIMPPFPKNPREMPDEEASGWMRDLIKNLVRERGSAEGACSLEALKNPVRRRILRELREKPLTIGELSERIGLGEEGLRYHIRILENSYFVITDEPYVDLTPGGVSAARNL